MRDPEKDGLAFGWYLQQRHELIRRHAEVLELRTDHTVDWELQIDVELPTGLDPWKGERGQSFFPFPLVFLKKVEGRRGFSILNESGRGLTVPIRAECDEFSTAGLLYAANALIKSVQPPLPSLDVGELEGLEDSLRRVIAEKPHQASMVLGRLRRRFGMLEKQEMGEDVGRLADIGSAWKDEGLDEILQMLVEHSLIWVPLEGRPGQRRSLVVRERKELHPRPFVRWAFGELREDSRWPGVRGRRKRAVEEIAASKAKKEIPNPRDAVALGEKPYGRRKRTISLSALGERIGRPLAWMPFEFRFPTIYAMRCASYHFECRCPPGRTPRDLRVATGPSLAERDPDKRPDRSLPPGSRTTLTSSVARVDVPPLKDSKKGSGWGSKDLYFRITVGIGNNNFPALWFLAAAITAVMLWLLADDSSSLIGKNGQLESLGGSDAQILAGILLVVPALVSALAVGSNDVPVTQLVGGARILLLVTGLSAVGATAVVAGARPWEISAESAWAICAMIATAATIPLGASWLLSSPQVWAWLKRLNSRRRQMRALTRVIGLALLGVGILVALPDDGANLGRGVLAVYLFVLTVAASVIGNDRAAMKVDRSRHYITVSFLAVGVICMALAFVEMRGAIAKPTSLQATAELAAVPLLLLMPLAGEALYQVTRLPGIKPAEGEVHVSPIVGQAMLKGERVLEFSVLREREEQAKKKKKEDEKRAEGNNEPLRTDGGSSPT